MYAHLEWISLVLDRILLVQSSHIFSILSFLLLDIDNALTLVDDEEGDILVAIEQS